MLSSGFRAILRRSGRVPARSKRFEQSKNLFLSNDLILAFSSSFNEWVNRCRRSRAGPSTRLGLRFSAGWQEYRLNSTEYSVWFPKLWFTRSSLLIPIIFEEDAYFRSKRWNDISFYYCWFSVNEKVSATLIWWSRNGKRSNQLWRRMEKERRKGA